MDGRLIQEIEPLERELFFHLAFSNNGRWLAVVTVQRPQAKGEEVPPRTEATILLWDLKEGRWHKNAFELPNVSVMRATAIDFSPDDKRVVFATSEYDRRRNAGSGRIVLWDPGSGKSAVRRGPSVSHVRFSPDGRKVAMASRQSVVLWDASRTAAYGRPILPPPIWRARDVGKNVESLAFSRDGKTLAAGSFDGKLKLWKVFEDDVAPATTTGFRRLAAQAATIPFDDAVRHLEFLPDGNGLLAQIGQDRLVVLRAARGEDLLAQTPTDGLLDFAAKYFNEDEHQLAMDMFTRVLEREPDNLLALINRASSYKVMGKPHEALQGYAAAKELHPDAYQGWMNLAFLVAGRNQPEEYRRRAGAMLDHFRETEDASTAYRVVLCR